MMELHQGQERGQEVTEGFTLTFVFAPAHHLRLLLMTDIEDFICVFCDGHVGGV